MALYDFVYKYKFDVFNTDGFDDFADRLSFKYSCFIFLVASVISVVKQYLFIPISCYIATESGGKHLINYIENYCWVEGTVPLNFSTKFPTNEDEWNIAEKKKILYYQWIPFIIPVLALGFYLPHMLWKLIYINNNGKSINGLIVKVNKAVIMDEESRKKEVKHLAKVLEMMIFETREDDDEKSSCLKKGITKLYEYFILGKRLGAYLIVFYWFIKLLYFINAIGQLFFIQSLLVPDFKYYSFFGYRLFYKELNDNISHHTPIFPKYGFCAVKFRHLGVTNIVIAQCALPVNIINENLFKFLWLWLIVLSIVTGISIIIWLFESYFKYNKTAFLNKYLKIKDISAYKELHKTLIRKFENQFLRHNGLFVLRMIANNSGDLITADIVNQLWTIYKDKYALKSFKQNRKTKRMTSNDDNDSFNSEKDNFFIKLNTSNNDEKSTFPNAPPLKETFSDL